MAFETKTFGNFALRKRTYRQVKERWGLGAQAAQHTIKKTADAYSTLRANLRAGNLGQPGSKRHRKAAGRPIAFRPDAAQPFDDRMLSWQIETRQVSIWTVRGRVKNLAFTGSDEQLKMLAGYRRGESDLVCRDGVWFLVATCEVPETELNTDPVDMLGVDLGIVNIATTSDGQIMAGRRLNRARARDVALRAKLQKKGTKSATRRLQRRRRKQARRTRDINHKISKHIVAEAKRTGRGIGLEELTGIRARVRLKKPQRAAVHSWSFAQLGGFIAYKARRAGVPVLYVDPAYTSRTCAQCGHIDKANRVSQAGSRAGRADSLITQTVTPPATSAHERGSCGDAGPSQRPPSFPDNGEGPDADAASQPVIARIASLSLQRRVVDFTGEVLIADLIRLSRANPTTLAVHGA